MDSKNRFDSPATHLLLRLECLAALGAAVALAFLHRAEIRWVPFAALFVAIDLVGYIPGAIAHRRGKGGPIAAIYYALYNATHSLLAGGAIAALWSVVAGPEWALLAIPIHLLGDRALFGNFYKPRGVAFEPETHPAFAAFEKEIARGAAR
jgi:hypothetical protein